MRNQITQRAPLEQFHHDVQITIVGRSEVGNSHRVRMLHASGGAGLSAKSLLRSLIAEESLAEDFQSYGPINKQVRRPINRAHPATAEPFIEPVFSVKDPAQKRIERDVSDSRIGLQRRMVTRTYEHIVRELPTTSRTLKHRELGPSGRARFIITQKA